MFEIIFRKKLLKEYSLDVQDMLIKLLLKKFSILYICKFTIVLFFSILYMCISVFTLTLKFNIYILLIYIILTLVLIILFIKVFFSKINQSTSNIRKKIYYQCCTRKGKAISSNDFKTIKEKSYNLYNFIAKQKCTGYCYSTCFSLLKILKKGSILFVGVSVLTKKSDNRSHTMHVLYVNNGWCFDSYSQRQFPLSEILNIYRAKIYSYFSIEDINLLSYQEFRNKYSNNLKIWCDANNVSQKWKND